MKNTGGSPEQAEMNQLDIDTRTDVYSLGVMLYELLTGSTPIDQETMKGVAILKVLESIRETEPPSPSSRLSSSTNEAVSGISSQRQIEPSKLKNILRGELDWIVMKALEKDRIRRYETANDFADDTNRFLNDDVVAARPPSTSYRIRKYVNKHKGLVASLATIATLLIAGIIGTSWFAVAASIAKKKADDKTVEAVKQKRFADQETKKALDAESDARVSESAAIKFQQETEATLARSNYFLAIARWEANRVPEAIDFLEKVPPKHRFLEWYLARHQFTVSGDLTCYGHTDRVNCVAFSPDGKRIATGSADKSIRLWDVQSGEQLVVLENSDRVYDIAFSPDGKRIVSGGDDNITLWNPEAGQKIWEYSREDGWSRCLAFSPDGNKISFADNRVGSRGGTNITFLDAITGEELSSHSVPVNSISCIAYSPNGTRLVLGSEDGYIAVCDALSCKQIIELQKKSQSTNRISGVAYSPDGTKIASAGLDSSIKLWDAQTGKKFWRLKENQNLTV